MLHNRVFIQFEFVTVFIAFPLLFILNILPISFLIPILWMLALYAFFILKSTQYKISFSMSFDFKFILLRFFLIGVAFLSLSYSYYPQMFLHMAMKESKLFIALLILYPIVSVLPQEFLYREFFFKRYSFNLNPKILLLLNAFIFMWAHIVFGNGTVLILTFMAGLLFAYTYLKSRSLLLVCIEHTLYGYLMFVSGLAELFFQSGTLSILRTLFS